jgi:hypothetical protein
MSKKPLRMLKKRSMQARRRAKRPAFMKMSPTTGGFPPWIAHHLLDFLRVRH